MFGLVPGVEHSPQECVGQITVLEIRPPQPLLVLGIDDVRGVTSLLAGSGWRPESAHSLYSATNRKESFLPVESWRVECSPTHCTNYDGNRRVLWSGT